MVRIVGTYPGNDGLVRKVRIKKRDREYDRPIHKLCLIAKKEELNARTMNTCMIFHSKKANRCSIRTTVSS